MRIDFRIDNMELIGFTRACEAMLTSVGNASQQATEQALWEIASDSLYQVPIETGTLAASLFMGIGYGPDVSLSGKSDIRGEYAGVIGYGSYEGALANIAEKRVRWLKAPEHHVNPITGRSPSFYANTVHEDLSKFHKVGKAKFLEEPLYNYAFSKLEPLVTAQWQTAIEWVERAPDRALWSSFRQAYKDAHGSWQQYTEKQIKDQVRALKRSEPFKGQHVFGPEGNERYHSRIIGYNKATHEPIVKFTHKKYFGGYYKKRVEVTHFRGNDFWRNQDPLPF